MMLRSSCVRVNCVVALTQTLCGLAAPERQYPEQALGLVGGQPGPGEADRQIAVLGGDPVSLTICLEALAVLVKPPAVELDDHLLVREQHVRFAAEGRRVGDGPGQAVPAAEGDEAVLELRASGVLVGV